MRLYLVTGARGSSARILSKNWCAGRARARRRQPCHGHKENLAAVARRIEFIEGDLAKADVAKRRAAGVDYILHQRPSVRASFGGGAGLLP